MNRKNTKAPQIAGPDEHFDTLGELLAQLKTHLAASEGKKGTYADYLRLLEFYRGARQTHAREITVRWVDNRDLEAQAP